MSEPLERPQNVCTFGDYWIFVQAAKVGHTEGTRMGAMHVHQRSGAWDWEELTPSEADRRMLRWIRDRGPFRLEELIRERSGYGPGGVCAALMGDFVSWRASGGV